MKVKIRVVNVDTQQSFVETYTLPILIGRSSDSTLQLDSQHVSRKHASLQASRGRLSVRHLSSTHETELKMVTAQGKEQTISVPHASARKRVNLQAGDVLIIYPFELNIETLIEQNVDSELTRPRKPLSIPQRSDYQISQFTEHETISIPLLQEEGFEVEDIPYLSLGGGLGSFTWVDHLMVYGARKQDIRVIGNDDIPYKRYRKLCRYSQIPDHERLRSNSDSCPDNIWGYPGYAAREIMRELARFDVGKVVALLWQIFNEPMVDTYTPISGRVFESIDREMLRIGWPDIWRYGLIRAVRKTDDGRYAVAYFPTPSNKRSPGARPNLIVADYLHIALGYPAVRFVDSLRQFHKHYRDADARYRVTNAYTNHEKIYNELKEDGGIVIVRGRGIVASRILQRLGEVRETLKGLYPNKDITVYHLMRSSKPSRQGGYSQGSPYRPVKHNVEIQPFNWPKSCWSGELRFLLEKSTPEERETLLEQWGGTTTADRKDWQRALDRAENEGWYRPIFGAVAKAHADSPAITLGSGKKLNVNIEHPNNQQQTLLKVDYIVDATGLIGELKHHYVWKDIIDTYTLRINPKGNLDVDENFEVSNLPHLYASGVCTLGGPYAAVDSFLGLQYAALRSTEHLLKSGAPGLKPMHPLRSLSQWLRWVGGVSP